MFYRQLISGIIIFFIMAGISFGGVWYLVKTPETNVPDLLTLSLEEAVRKASNQGFNIRLENEESTDLLPPGHIISQRPEPGFPVKEGSTIRITLATARPNS